MSTLKNAATLSIGNGLAQAISLIGFAFLARIYTPSQFGSLAVVMGVSSIASVAVSGRYEMTILLPRSDRLAELALTTAIALSVLTTVAFALVMIVATRTTGLEWPKYWPAISLMTFCSAAVQAYGYKRNRERRYKHTVYVQVMRSISLVIFSISLAGREDGLVWGHVAGSVAALVACLVIEYQVEKKLISFFSFRRMIFWLRRNDEFLKYSLPAVLTNSFSAQLPVFLLSHYFGVQAAGYYSFVNKTVMAPVTLVAGSLNVVNMQKFASMSAHGREIAPNLLSVTKKLSAVGMFASLAFAVFCLLSGYEIVFGEAWSPLDTLAITFTPILMVSSVSRSLPGFAVLGQNRSGLVYQILLTCGTVLSIYVSYQLWRDLLSTFAAYSVTVSTIYLAQVVAINSIARFRDKRLEHLDG